MYTPVPIAVVAALRERIRCLEVGARDRRAVLPFGIRAIDERLPEGGLALGALHEVAGGGNGAIDGAAAALFAAGIAARTRGRVLWCVTRLDLFAPAIASAGLAPDRVIYVEAGDEKSVLACFEEGLRHGRLHGGGLGAVIAEVARLSMTASRRLQLAAEGSGAIGIAIRRLSHMRGKGIGAGASAPSPRLPSGRLRPSSTGYGEGRGEEALPQTETRFQSSDSRRRPLTRNLRDERANSDLSPQAGRGEGRGQMRLLSHSGALPQGGEPGIHTPRSVVMDSGIAAFAASRNDAAYDSKFKIAELARRSQDFGQPTAAVTRWRVSALPSQPLPVPGVGRARWQLELIRCRGGESAEFEVEACDAQGRLALPSDLVNGSDQKAIGQRRTAR
jgi:hypothetical protein